MSEGSPLQCRPAGCGGAAGVAIDGSRRLDFGRSRPVIRISAGNGPVDVRSGTPARRTAWI